MNDLNGKNIIITGASGGIGNSIVKKFSDCGSNIIASGTKIEKLNDLKSQFKNLKIIKFDVHNPKKSRNLSIMQQMSLEKIGLYSK